jgi:hypothetical protein
MICQRIVLISERVFIFLYKTLSSDSVYLKESLNMHNGDIELISSTNIIRVFYLVHTTRSYNP